MTLLLGLVYHPIGSLKWSQDAVSHRPSFFSGWFKSLNREKTERLGMKARRRQPLMITKIHYADSDDVGKRKIMEVYRLLLRSPSKEHRRGNNKGRRT